MLKEARLRDPKYLIWVRELPCIACWLETGANPDHTNLPMQGAKGLKSSDSQVIPLCHRCHTLRHNIGVKTFYEENTGHTVQECVDLAKRIYAAYKEGQTHDAVKWNLLMGWRK